MRLFELVGAKRALRDMTGSALEGLKGLIRRRFAGRSALIGGLLELAEGLSGQSTHEEKLEGICRAVQRLLLCDRSSLFIRSHGYFVGAFNVGNPPAIEQDFYTHRVALHDPLIADAFTRRSYVVSNRAESDPRMHKGVRRKANINAIVVAPLFDSDAQPLAFLTAEFNQSTGRFNETESQILMGIAAIAEIVLRDELLSKDQHRMNQQVLRISQLETMGRLSAGVAHDLNNRLTVLLGGLELLEKRRAEEVAPLLASVRAASRMSRQLLQFSKTSADDTGYCFVPGALKGIEHELKFAIASRCALIVEEPKPVWVQCSVSQLEQIISNLVINAADASQPGDQVIVRDFVNDAHDTWVIVVADSGHGIPPEVRENLYEAFVSTKPTGSGLGLASVKSIVDSLGGTITFDTEVGVGTRFEVSLPLATERTEVDLVVAGRVPEVTVAMPGTIIVVDDDDPVRKHIADHLTEQGHTVLSFAAAGDALRALTIVPDLVIADIVMPDQDGFAFSRELRSHYPALPLLLTSGYYPQIMDANIPGDGAVQFMSKPFSLGELQTHVASLLTGPGANMLDMSAD